MRGRTIASGLVAALLFAPPQLALAADQTDKAATATQNPFLRAGIRLYNGLEFDKALEQLKKAEGSKGNSVNDEVLIHIYEGIVQYESNHKDEAEAQFKTALALNPNAQLPKNISPKTAALFEKVRAQMASEKEVVAPSAQPEVPPAKPPEPAAQPAAGGLKSTAEVKREESGPSVAPWVALGAGAVAAGAGGFFALRAHSLGSDAQGAQFQDDANQKLSDAKSSATIAYASLGVAAVAVGAFAVLYLTSDHDSSASSGAGSDAK